MTVQNPSKVDFQSFFKGARSQIIIVGTNPLLPELESSGRFFADLLSLNTSLTLTILYESDNENFNQALCIDTKAAERRVSFSTLSLHRDRIAGVREGTGLLADILAALPDFSKRKEVGQRVLLRQVNLRMPINVIMVDGRVYAGLTAHTLPTLADYREIEQDDPWFQTLSELPNFYTNSKLGGIYLSKPIEELIEMYDRQGIPRGIFPRKCFYTTRYQRYSIWGFVFNRHGELLLHRRSAQTKDNRLMWDKSIGGHVDIADRSSLVTAQRELVEELFLPEAEFTKYIRADLGEIVNFGVWSPRKRPESQLRGAFKGLGPSDWIVFRATNPDGEPLTVTRKSVRTRHADGEEVRRVPTIFMSDVYLFIAPDSFIDTEEQMHGLFEVAEERGAATEHRLVSMDSLREWIEEEEVAGTAESTFTDDLLHINEEYRGMLEQFSAFIRYAKSASA